MGRVVSRTVHSVPAEPDSIVQRVSGSRPSCSINRSHKSEGSLCFAHTKPTQNTSHHQLPQSATTIDRTLTIPSLCCQHCTGSPQLSRPLRPVTAEHCLDVPLTTCSTAFNLVSRLATPNLQHAVTTLRSPVCVTTQGRAHDHQARARPSQQTHL